MSRKRGKVEHAEYAAMMRRLIAAHARRVADGDVEDLAELVALRNQLDAAIGDAVHGMRAAHGRSWADIAQATGTTRQAAFQRWGRERRPGAAAAAELTEPLPGV